MPLGRRRHITPNSETPPSTRLPHSLIYCRITSKNDRLPASLSRLLQTPKVMPTLGWKPEANDVIILCVTISNPLSGNLMLNISQTHGPNRCRKKHSKRFMLQSPFSLRIYGSSSSITSRGRRQQPSVTTSSHARPSSSQL